MYVSPPWGTFSCDYSLLLLIPCRYIYIYCFHILRIIWASATISPSAPCHPVPHQRRHRIRPPHLQFWRPVLVGEKLAKEMGWIPVENAGLMGFLAGLMAFLAGLMAFLAGFMGFRAG